MASTFWIGTNVKVTNGSATVEVTSGDVITKVKENAVFVTSNFSLPYEVDQLNLSGRNQKCSISTFENILN